MFDSPLDQKMYVLKLKRFFKTRVSRKDISKFHEAIEKCLDECRIVVLDFSDFELSISETYLFLTQFFSRIGKKRFQRYIKFSNISDVQKLSIENQLHVVFSLKGPSKREKLIRPNTVEYMYKFFSSRQEVCTLLGVHRQTLTAWKNKGYIPYHALRKLHYITNGKINHTNMPHRAPRFAMYKI